MDRYERLLERFIPACAGNITSEAFKVETFSVHPRVCGEHKMQGHKETDDNGSSPRVRGT